MKTKALMLFLATLSIYSCKNETKQETNTGNQINTEQESQDYNTGIIIHPVSHASMVLEWGPTFIYNDPVGGKAVYDNIPGPAAFILISDIHGDHLDKETLQSLVTAETIIFAPEGVITQLPENLKKISRQVNNDETVTYDGFSITGIPMYNLREEALEFHIKGRGNGYLLEKEGKRVYISGDTEDIPEMRSLENIDIAFICMNLPYTMPMESAADAVIEFKPKNVLPYHYRGKDGFQDVEEFKKIITERAPGVNVILMDWYHE